MPPGVRAGLLALALGGAAGGCFLPGDSGDAARPEGSTNPGAPSGVPPRPGPSDTRLPRVAPPFDPVSTAEAIDAWPLLVPGVSARSVTSYDRSGGNDDGFGGTYSTLYVDGRNEHVVFDELGPGVLRTLWLTSALDGDAPLGVGQLRFYFDDEEQPRITIDADALFAGTTPPFVAPLVAANQTTSGGFASWAPLAYRSRLRVTAERRLGFIQLHYDSLPADWDVATSTATDAALAARFAAGASTLPLESVPLDVTRTGAGVVDVLRFAPAAAPTDEALRAARIRVWFDGAADPQVDLPLGFFFGSGRGVAPIQSVAWTMEPSRFESRLPMPFWDGVRVQIEGIDGALSLHVAPERWTRAEAGTLETRFSSELPTVAGQDHPYADLTGSGKIVATVLAVDPVVASLKGWWEGDLRTRVDDARTPAIHGTGHEDDHLGGWSNEFLMRPFTQPMQGAPRTDLYDTGAEFQKNGATTVYRLWSGIPFFRSIRHSTEHGPSNTREARYESATFLYRQIAPRLARTDAFDVADDAAAKAHAYAAIGAVRSTLTSAFEGERGEPLTAAEDRTAGEVRFELAIDPANDGVFLRRVFDRDEHAKGPTSFALEVDGVHVTAASASGPVATARRWAERDVFLPAQATRGKSKLALRLLPAVPISVARLEAWTVAPPPK